MRKKINVKVASDKTSKVKSSKRLVAVGKNF